MYKYICKVEKHFPQVSFNISASFFTQLTYCFRDVSILRSGVRSLNNEAYTHSKQPQFENNR